MYIIYFTLDDNAYDGGITITDSEYVKDTEIVSDKLWNYLPCKEFYDKDVFQHTSNSLLYVICTKELTEAFSILSDICYTLGFEHGEQMEYNSHTR